MGQHRHVKKKPQNELFSPDSLRLTPVLLLFTGLDMHYFWLFHQKGNSWHLSL